MTIFIFRSITLATLLFAFIFTQNAFGQLRQNPENSDSIFVHNTDTSNSDNIIGELIEEIESGNINSENKSFTLETAEKSGYKKIGAIDFYRSLIDSLHTFGIEFRRDSIASVIISNDPLFNNNWITNQVHPVDTTLEKVIPETLLELIKGNERHYYSWYGGLTWGVGPRWGRLHKGIDTKLQKGDTIHATFNGIVRYAGYNSGGYGKVIVIRHFNGIETLYAHLSALDVKAGDLVFAGEPIGRGGSSGKSYGAHLHFETRLYGKPFDPLLLMDKENEMMLLSSEIVIANGDMLESSGHHHHSHTVKNSNYHIVRKGDTIFSLAKKYNSTPAKLTSLNRLKSSHQITIGQKLKVR